MLLQAEEVCNPTTFLPGLASKHRPPAKCILYGLQGKSNKREKSPKPAKKVVKRKKITSITKPSPPPKRRKVLMKNVSEEEDNDDEIESLDKEMYRQGLEDDSGFCDESICFELATGEEVDAVEEIVQQHFTLEKEKESHTSMEENVQSTLKNCCRKGRGKGRGRGTAGNVKSPLPLCCALQNKIDIAKAIIGEEISQFVVPKSHRLGNPNRNPPMVCLLQHKRVSRCQGCNGRITDEDKRPPHNMVLKIHGARQFTNPRGDQMETFGNLCFHLSMQCFRKKYPAEQWQNFCCPEEDFCAMTQGNFQQLNNEGFLPYMVANLM